MNPRRFINVSYNPTNSPQWTFSNGSNNTKNIDTNNNCIYCATGGNLVTFTLTSRGATFLPNNGTTSPFSWVTVLGSPSTITPPAGIGSINVSSDSLQASFLDINSEPGAYEILLNIMYQDTNGESYVTSPDPTLVNEATG